MEIKLTTDWILKNLSALDINIENYSGLAFTNSPTEFTFVILAFETLKVKYEVYDDIAEVSNIHIQGCKFNVEDIKDSCPESYKELKKIQKLVYDSKK